MPRIAAFEAHAERYEAWFARNEAVYRSELFAVRALLPWSGRGLEIGMGSGGFAAPLGIQVGVDSSPAMLALAAARDIEVVAGTAEQLPFPSVLWIRRRECWPRRTGCSNQRDRW